MPFSFRILTALPGGSFAESTISLMRASLMPLTMTACIAPASSRTGRAATVIHSEFIRLTIGSLMVTFPWRAALK